MIIGISGKAQAGKDTIGSMLAYFFYSGGNTGFLNFRRLRDYYKETSWEHKYFALPLKQCLCSILNCTLEDLNNQNYKTSKLPWLNSCTVRDLLQKFVTWIRQTVDEDFWVKALFKDYKNTSNWIITDVRFPTEADSIKSRNGILIRVNRKSSGAGDHISETALDTYNKYDYIIENNGSLEDLFWKVWEIYKLIWEKQVI